MHAIAKPGAPPSITSLLHCHSSLTVARAARARRVLQLANGAPTHRAPGRDPHVPGAGRRAALTSDALQPRSCLAPTSSAHTATVLAAQCPRIRFHSPTKRIIPTSAHATALAHEPLLPPRASSTDPRTSTSDEALASAPSLASAPLLTSRRLGALTSLSPVRARRLSIAAPPWHIHARTRSSYARALCRTRPLTPCHMRTRTRPHRGVELSQMR